MLKKLLKIFFRKLAAQTSPSGSPHPLCIQNVKLKVNLKEFDLLNELPLHLQRRCSPYDSNDSLVETFLQNNAVFYKSCIAAYNKQKLSRKGKLRESIDAQEDHISLNNEETPVDERSARTSRASQEMKNFVSVCFFCGTDDNRVNLHQCLTLDVHHRVKRFAKNLGDTKLLAKISEGDMVAIETKYHLKCLVGFYNKHRAHTKRNPENASEDAILTGIFTLFWF